MKTYSKEELKEILDKHELWLTDSTKGERANLRKANLGGANFEGANLRKANLEKANFEGAKFEGANLERAYLGGANLEGALGIIKIESQYPYLNYAYFYNNQKRVRLGCHDRTIEEWDADFWNNDKEFPKNSPQGKNRWFIYTCYRQWLIDNEELEMK
jgi:hypothetical protein